MTAVIAVNQPPLLTLRDRCDRCCAAAVYRFTLNKGGGLELLFCRHHEREHHDKLTRDVGSLWSNP
jgi:hypothetical protein